MSYFLYLANMRPDAKQRVAVKKGKIDAENRQFNTDWMAKNEFIENVPGVSRSVCCAVNASLLPRNGICRST